MHNTTIDPVYQERIHSGLVWWNHTEIEAPYRFNVEEPEPRTPYRLTLKHPEHGAVGLLDHYNDRSIVQFHPYDSAVFGVDDLKAFAAQCFQDGAAMSTTNDGFDYFLEELATQCMTDLDVAWSKQAGGFLVRPYTALHELSHGDRRGDVLRYRKIILDIRERRAIEAELHSDPDTTMPTGGYWQMFDGESWTVLAPPPATDPSAAARQLAERDTGLRAIESLRTTPRAALRDAGPILVGLYATSLGHDTVRLVDDPRNCTIRVDQWCRCKTRPRLVQFQHWAADGIVAEGTAHASQGCRRLVTID